MAKNLSEFAINYAKRIKSSKNKEKETQKILDEIDNLIYENSKNHISKEDKITLLKELKNELEKPLMIDGKFISLSEADNKNYLDLINTVLVALKQQDSDQ